jgi:hypothetical protein
MRTPALLILLAALAGCQTAATNGPSRLEGQNLDAAMALYGPWVEQVHLQGRPVYIWRRTLIAAGKPYVCELRLETGFRGAISKAYLQGVPNACQLFALKEEALTK